MKKIFLFLGLVICLSIGIISLLFIKPPKNNLISPISPLPPPQISGWIAWWEEQAAYDLVQKFPGKINTVSPVWFTIDKNLELKDIGEINREEIIEQIKKSHVRNFPSIGSELSGEKLSLLFNDTNKVNTLIENIAYDIKLLGVDGVDVDLEGIKKSDRDKFTFFLSKLSKRIKKDNMKMAVTVHAQTEKKAWEGVDGQDLEKIGNIADEVRIMIYDEHSSASKPGAISSFTWIENVVAYNLKKIDKDKIVIGIPSYGYIWTNDGNAKGLQFHEFSKYLEDKKYQTSRDNRSQELVVTSNNFSGWLSDSIAMTAKINLLRSLGLNKFIIWHLGGMDENLFSENWST